MTAKNFLFLIVLLLLSLQSSHAQSFLSNSGANAAAMGYTGVTGTNYSSPFNNIAGIAGIKAFTVSGSANNYFNIPGLKNINLNAIYPTHGFAFSISALKNGDEYFSMQKFSIGAAHKVGFMQMGIQVGYLQYYADELGSRGTIVLDFGGIAAFSDKLKFGAHLLNFTQATLYTDPPESLPLIMKAGLCYSPIEKLRLAIELEKEIESEPLRKAGIEYQILEGIYLRSGVTFDPIKNYFGLGFHRGKFLVDYAFTNHPRLGLSHHVSLAIKISNAKHIKNTGPGKTINSKPHKHE